MSNGDTGKSLERVAREMVDRLGIDAAAVLRERAEQIEAAGDRVSAQSLRDIADVAEGMLKDPCRLLVVPAH